MKQFIACENLGAIGYVIRIYKQKNEKTITSLSNLVIVPKLAR